MIQNVWGLVAVLIFYAVILVIGIVAGRKAKKSGKDTNSEEVMLAGRNIGMVRISGHVHGSQEVGKSLGNCFGLVPDCVL